MRLTGLAVPQPRVWDPTAPPPMALHTLTVSLQGAAPPPTPPGFVEPGWGCLAPATGRCSASDMAWDRIAPIRYDDEVSCNAAGCPGPVKPTPAPPVPLPVDADAVTVRFGLRTVGRRGRAITLNGKPLKLRGFNRHDLYPQLGPALPAAQYTADLDALQHTLNGNFVRGSHYPQDGRFLDLCDERGVLVWNEALAWGNWAAQLTDPRFMRAELATAHAMVDTAAEPGTSAPMDTGRPKVTPLKRPYGPDDDAGVPSSELG